jgi:hypothetical protein
MCQFVQQQRHGWKLHPQTFMPLYQLILPNTPPPSCMRNNDGGAHNIGHGKNLVYPMRQLSFTNTGNDDQFVHSAFKILL